MTRPRVRQADHTDGDRQLIYVTGWPKSGCTWLTRLLGDVLDCPTGGTIAGKDHKELAAEGWDRPAPYVVRKAHFVLVDEGGSLVPRPHRLDWKKLADERVIHIMRDPRDIAVSMAFYFEYSIGKALQQLKSGWRMPIEGGWVEHIQEWIGVQFPCVHTSFELLTDDCVEETRRILLESGLPLDGARLPGAIQRQSFAVRRQHVIDQGEKYARGEPHYVYLRGTDWNLRFMRKGIVGDWKNHFTRKQGEQAQRFFGPMMKQLGYIKNEDWWKAL